MEQDKENFFRKRFHSRGLSKTYKSSSSSSTEDASSPLSSNLAASSRSNIPTSHKPQQILVERQFLNTENSFSAEQSSEWKKKDLEDITDKGVLNSSTSMTTQCTVDNAPEIVGTPTVSLRKGLLDRNHVDLHRIDRELSPSLQRLVSTPTLERIKSAVKNQLESSQLGKSFTLHTDRKSPGLTRLRQTPGKPLREKQRVIVDKHDETRRHADTLNIGGGVSLWPGMENMRLSRQEFLHLVLLSGVLVVVVFYGFSTVHGTTLSKLEDLYLELEAFKLGHAINATSTHLLTLTSLQWHRDFGLLIEKIESSFGLSSDDTGVPCMFYIFSLLYLFGLTILLYYLADNVMSSNKLSPNRIKKWVCLLIVMGSWTLNMGRLCYAAFQLEKSVESNVLWLNEQQKEMVYQHLDMHTYDHVLRYWTVKCVSSTSSGVLTILGILQYNSLIHYIQYYSLPIVTALISPLVKLILSVFYVYGLIDHCT